MASPPRVELLWWRECPSWERALQMLRGEMEKKGFDPDSIEVREIDTESAARQGQFVGSPTIRVNGVDIQPPADGESAGLTCRVYRHRDGRISPLPDSEDVREALGAVAVR
jgi:hypothetical protein